MKTCQVMLCTTDRGGGGGSDRSEKIWGAPPLQKVTQREVSERVGCVVGVGWSYMGPRGSVSAPQAHPVWDGIGDRGVSFPGQGGGGVGWWQRNGPERKVTSLLLLLLSGRRDGGGVEEYITVGLSTSRRLQLSPVADSSPPLSPVRANVERGRDDEWRENK